MFLQGVQSAVSVSVYSNTSFVQPKHSLEQGTEDSTEGFEDDAEVASTGMESFEIAGVETDLLCLDPLWIFTPFLDPDL